jgi:UPF0755 protein
VPRTTDDGQADRAGDRPGDSFERSTGGDNVRRARWTPGRPRRRLRPVAALAIFALALLIPVGIYFIIVRPYFATGTPGAEVRVTIPEGATLSEIAGLLEEAGVVRHATAFRIEAERAGHAADLKPGTYTMQVNQPFDRLIAQLVAGARPETVKITIPEGYTAQQTGQLVSEKLKRATEKAYRRLTIEHPLPFGLPGYRPGTRLEGLLFPATYEMPPSSGTRALVERQLEAFKETMAGIDMTRARKANLTAYDVAIIGSMVEREAKVARERPLVAAVIWNRLRLGMPLQIDATVQYALPQHKTSLTYADLNTPSPYNTYLHTGLPPTPIANAGAASLEAAANPARVDYLYYVARGDGSGRHYFSSTYEQFLQDKARAQGH